MVDYEREAIICGAELFDFVNQAVQEDVMVYQRAADHFQFAVDMPGLHDFWKEVMNIDIARGVESRYIAGKGLMSPHCRGDIVEKIPALSHCL